MSINTRSIKFKIIVSITLLVIVVGVTSNLFLYQYLNGIILEKARGMNDLYLNNIQTQLEANLRETYNLGILCSNDPDVAESLTDNKPDTAKSGKEALRIQKILNTYLHSCTAERYIRRLIAFNENGFSVHANTSAYGNITDVPDIMNTKIFKQRNNSLKAPFNSVYQSIDQYDGKCLTLLFQVSNPGVPQSNSYLYIEADMRLVVDVLTPYSKLNNIFLETANGDYITNPSKSTSLFAQSVVFPALKPYDTVKQGTDTYEVYIKTLPLTKMTLYDAINISSLELDSQKIYYTVLITILTCVLVGIGLLIMISSFITRPISRLISRIKKISQNDFSFDPEIERSKDEIGDIGKVVNEMSGSIQALLNETVENTEKQKNIEIALLQSQVNPHFLYNTLDSIHWMAVVQKNPGICNITRSLTNLLKNMAKGFSAKIPLSEELSLLNDYTTIQSIRYLETFEIVNHINQKYNSFLIIKMTLQPLVENAIFHGIEPKGTCGTVTLDAWDDNDYFYLSIHDNGVGMTGEEIHQLLKQNKENTRDTMNGIGVANVDARLKLTYGKDCGIAIDSVKGEYTKVTVKIRKEEGEVRNVSDTSC